MKKRITKTIRKKNQNEFSYPAISAIHLITNAGNATDSKISIINAIIKTTITPTASFINYTPLLPKPLSPRVPCSKDFTFFILVRGIKLGTN